MLGVKTKKAILNNFNKFHWILITMRFTFKTC